jgi:Bifunctional DNA primase/polymerase, N-terminal
MAEPTTLRDVLAVERVAEYSALPVLPAWFDALKVHADFFPTGLDKAPTCGSPRYSATTDTEILGNWSGQHRTAGFAARIRRGSRLMVIDLDQKNGHDGFTALGYVLLDHDIELPAGPVVQTPHGGRHLYMLRPARSPKIVSQVGIWDGADIMAEEGQFILPGSKIRDGEYTLLEGSLNAIPDAPLAMLQAIHEKQKACKVINRKATRKAAPPLPFNDAPICLTPQERFRLFNNKVFRSFWNMGKEQGDTSLSAYEFHLAKACYCVGLDTDQTVIVIQWWWKHHSLAGRSEKKLLKGIIPAAWRAVADYVVGWKASHRSVHTTTCITTETVAMNKGGRPLSKRTLLVLELADQNPEWEIARIASAAVVSRQSAWNALRRHRPGRQALHQTASITSETALTIV